MFRADPRTPAHGVRADMNRARRRDRGAGTGDGAVPRVRVRVDECAHGLRKGCGLPGFSWRSRGKFMGYTELPLAACGENRPHSGCDHNKQGLVPGQAAGRGVPRQRHSARYDSSRMRPARAGRDGDRARGRRPGASAGKPGVPRVASRYRRGVRAGPAACGSRPGVGPLPPTRTDQSGWEEKQKKQWDRE